jgi:hypothetical protein
MPQPSPIEPSISVRKFCELEGISHTANYSMKKRGEGPDETHVGNRRLISPESHRAWRRRRTRRAGKSAPAISPKEQEGPQTAL